MGDKEIRYSNKYYDDVYEYRQVYLPKRFVRRVPRKHLMTEGEWRALGIEQSPDWEHYKYHETEPSIILFRRPRTDVPADVSSENEPSRPNPAGA